MKNETAKPDGRCSCALAHCPFPPPKRAPPLLIFFGPNPYWVPYLICYKTPLHNKNPTPSSILLPSDNNTSTTLDPSLVHYNYILLILFLPWSSLYFLITIIQHLLLNMNPRLFIHFACLFYILRVSEGWNWKICWPVAKIRRGSNCIFLALNWVHLSPKWSIHSCCVV